MIIDFDNGRSKNETTPRCVVYARYSSDLQNQTSIADQIRNCREFAESKDWAFLSDDNRSDKGISGASLFARKGLLALIEDAKKIPRPFDCLLIDSTSRFGRNLSDVLRVSDTFRFHGVFLYFVTQGLDSRDATYRTLLTIHGMRDEDFLVAHRHNVFRGMKGKVEDGFHTGGTRYGYRSVLIENPTKKDEHGRPRIDKSRLEILPNQRDIVLHIYTMRVTGASYSAIAKDLNSKQVPAPLGGHWSYSTIKAILANELYRGIVKWNFTSSDTNPETGEKRVLKTPESQCIVVDHPELRIVSDELWYGAQKTNQEMKKFGRARLGGLARTSGKIVRLFSGLLKCGECGGSMAIIGASGTIQYYGCRAHRQEGACSNRLTIRLDRLEEQLLDAIMNRLRPEVLERSLTRLQREISEYLGEVSTGMAGDDISALHKQLAELNKQQSNVTRAIAVYGESQALFAELGAIEVEISDLKRRLNQSTPRFEKPISSENFRTFVYQKAADLRNVLLGDRNLAQQALRAIIRKLILMPVSTTDGPAFVVSGDVSLLAAESDVMSSTEVEHSAKHYAFPLSLAGLQLDPRKGVRADGSTPCHCDIPVVPVTADTGHVARA